MTRTVILGPALFVLGAVACSGEVGLDDTMSPAGTMDSFGSASAGPAMYDASGNPIPAAVPGASAGPSAGPNATGAPGTPTSSIPGVEPVDPSEPFDVTQVPPLPLLFDGEPLYARAVRLTHEQWENSVRYVLGIAETGHRQHLAGDVSALYEFSNHEELLFLNANLYRDYQMAAEELAAAAGMDAGQLSAMYPGQDAEGFIETVGRRAFRRPLTIEETQTLLALYDQGAELSENGETPHARGAALVLEALLQSPHFSYRLETGEPGERLSGYELAAKLSLLLLNATPDDELLDLAQSGGLDGDAGVSAVAQDMLGREAAALVMRNYHAELFKFDRYLSITKNAELVPEYTEELNEELQGAAYLFFDRIFREDLGVREMLTSTVGYYGPLMAPLYGFAASGQGFEQADLGPERPGFFTHLPFLILNAVNLTPDAIHRGVAINFEVLCGEIPPPPDAMVALEPATAGQTNRERVTATSGPGTCGQPCHAPYINPLGFAFENYDGMGRLRELDNGLVVDTRAAYPFVEGAMEFDGAAQLMQILSEGQQAHACYAKRLMTFALQRDLVEADRAAIDVMAADSRAGASLEELLLMTVTDPVFTTRASGGAQ